MTEQNTTTLARAIIAIKAGDMAAGQQLLEELLQREPDNVSGWLWLSAAVRSDEERRHCLEQVLRIHPNHPQALRGLEKLSPPSPVSGLPSSEPPSPVPGLPSYPSTSELPPSPWALEPDQPDLAPETPLGKVDPAEYLSSAEAALNEAHSAAAKSEGLAPRHEGPAPRHEGPAFWDEIPAAEGEAEPPAFEWRFGQDEPAGGAVSGAPGGAIGGAVGGTRTPPEQGWQPEDELSAEDSLDRFLGIEPPHGSLRGFKEPEPLTPEQPVPAFIFDEQESLDELLGPEEALREAGQAGLGIEDRGVGVGTSDSAPRSPASELPRLWANPGGKPNCLCILRAGYLILANPDPLFIDRIRDEVAHGEVKKKSIGRTARAIPLKALLLLTCEPEGTSFEVTYLQGKQRLREKAEFASIDERDDAVEALADMLGPGFDIRELVTTRLQNIWLPLVVLILALIGTPLLAYAASLVSMPLVYAAAGIGLLLSLTALAWLLTKFRQPLRLIVITPKRPETED